MGSRLAAGVLALALGVGAWALFATGQHVDDPLAPGDLAPAFALPRVPSASGEAPLTLEALRGRVVLLNFWATWCKPCEDEMPAMERLRRQLAPRGFELVAVSVDAREEDVVAFRERLGLSFPIVHDRDREVADAYQAYRFPESWLIDAEGRLVGRFIGPREWDAPSYVERVEALLEAGRG